MVDDRPLSLPLVLAVDDEAENLHLLEQVLKESYRLAFAKDGNQAIRAIKKVRPNLVLLDIMMPGMDGFAVLEHIKSDEAVCDTPVIFITSLSEEGDKDKGLSAGAVDYITKPFKREDVLARVKNHLTGKGIEETSVKKESLNILLVEDNEINCYLAAESLKKYAHEVTMAGDGKECLAMLDKSDYDVVLMDVMMPEMDGFEATRSIREREEKEGGHIPIIALTAGAAREDEARCMEAGMDDYLTKPINFSLLMEKIYALTGISATIQEKTAETAPVEGGVTALYDFSLLKEKIDDEEKLRSLLTWFVSDTSQQIEMAEQGLADGETEQVVKSCHKIRGSAESIRAGELKRCAEEAEVAGKAGDVEGSRRKMGAVKVSYALIAGELGKEFDLTV